MHKSPLVLALCFLLSANSAFCQSQIGITGGIGTASKTNYVFPQGGSFGRSFTAGFQYQLHLKNALALRTEVLYEHRVIGIGDMVFVNSAGQPVKMPKIQIAFDYISVPVLIRTSAGTKLKPFAEGGLFLGYWLNSTWITERPDGTRLTEKLPMTNAKRIELGIALGGGVSFPFGEKLLLSLALRGNIGLTNTEKNPGRGKPICNEELYLMPGLAYRL
jgi:hypothetical protein